MFMAVCMILSIVPAVNASAEEPMPAHMKEGRTGGNGLSVSFRCGMRCCDDGSGILIVQE